MTYAAVAAVSCLFVTGTVGGPLGLWVGGGGGSVQGLCLQLTFAMDRESMDARALVVGGLAVVIQSKSNPQRCPHLFFHSVRG